MERGAPQFPRQLFPVVSFVHSRYSFTTEAREQFTNVAVYGNAAPFGAKQRDRCSVVSFAISPSPFFHHPSKIHIGATVAERLDRSPPTKAKWVQSLAVRIVPEDADGRFTRLFSPTLLHIHLTSTLIGSQDLAVKSRPYLFTSKSHLFRATVIGVGQCWVHAQKTNKRSTSYLVYGAGRGGCRCRIRHTSSSSAVVVTAAGSPGHGSRAGGSSRRQARGQHLAAAAVGDPTTLLRRASSETLARLACIRRIYRYRTPVRRIRVREGWRSAGMKGRGKREIPEKTRRPAASSHMRKSGVIRPGIEPGSLWWEASRLTAQPPRPLRTRNHKNLLNKFLSCSLAASHQFAATPRLSLAASTSDIAVSRELSRKLLLPPLHHGIPLLRHPHLISPSSALDHPPTPPFSRKLKGRRSHPICAEHVSSRSRKGAIHRPLTCPGDNGDPTSSRPLAHWCYVICSCTGVGRSGENRYPLIKTPGVASHHAYLRRVVYPARRFWVKQLRGSNTQDRIQRVEKKKGGGIQVSTGSTGGVIPNSASSPPPGGLVPPTSLVTKLNPAGGAPAGGRAAAQPGVGKQAVECRRRGGCGVSLGAVQWSPRVAVHATSTGKWLGEARRGRRSARPEVNARGGPAAHIRVPPPAAAVQASPRRQHSIAILVHTLFDIFWRTLTQSSPSNLAAVNQFTVDIGIFVPKTVVSSLQTAYHPGEQGSIPGGVSSGFSHVGIVAADAAARRVFSGISRFPRPFIPALLHTRLASLSLALKTSLLRAAQITSLTHALKDAESTSTGILIPYVRSFFSCKLKPCLGLKNTVSREHAFAQPGERALLRALPRSRSAELKTTTLSFLSDVMLTADPERREIITSRTPDRRRTNRLCHE
ncbi:hypothetical protein PR048_028882 [Dryococelus australis]|uniref:Uncharacterized protein n=1 Tax=Dryococelus australis TaxID=614101 RepID=A0ABQ9GBT8_9NEOP|nr:hypothetical protein PR048_028882 [Dryococelus australis]